MGWPMPRIRRRGHSRRSLFAVERLSILDRMALRSGIVHWKQPLPWCVIQSADDLREAWNVLRPVLMDVGSHDWPLGNKFHFERPECFWLFDAPDVKPGERLAYLQAHNLLTEPEIFALASATGSGPGISSTARR